MHGNLLGSDKITLLKRLGIKLTSRKLWGFLIVIALVVVVGFVGGWALAVDLGKVVVPVAITALVGGVAYEKRQGAQRSLQASPVDDPRKG